MRLFSPLSTLLLVAPVLVLLAGCGVTRMARADSPPGPAAPVEVVRLPNGGYQPQVARDARGVLHVAYLQGEASAADLFYARRDGKHWSAPLRVSRRPGVAVGVGTIRGPQLALGGSGRVHLVWFGSDRAGIKGPQGSAPLLYTRSNEAGTAFEPERNLMHVTTALDGGPGLAADAKGGVYVAWHANEKTGQPESERRLWVARSTDEGKTFSREAPAWDEPTGACPCCSTEAFADSHGSLYLLYRMAAKGTERDMVLLTSADRGRTFRGARLDPWPVDT